MSQGHWRTLKSDHVGEGRYGERTQGKTWVDRKETKATLAAKKKGVVPIPMLVKVADGFGVFAVPGGEVMFVVHKSLMKDFMGTLIKDKKNWANSKSLKKLMVKGEKSGKFGIFRTQRPVLDY